MAERLSKKDARRIIAALMAKPGSKRDTVLDEVPAVALADGHRLGARLAGARALCHLVAETIAAGDDDDAWSRLRSALLAMRSTVHKIGEKRLSVMAAIDDARLFYPRTPDAAPPLAQCPGCFAWTSVTPCACGVAVVIPGAREAFNAARTGAKGQLFSDLVRIAPEFERLEEDALRAALEEKKPSLPRVAADLCLSVGAFGASDRGGDSGDRHRLINLFQQTLANARKAKGHDEK